GLESGGQHPALLPPLCHESSAGLRPGWPSDGCSLRAGAGMRPLQAHCHCGLGTLYATTGRREQARAALAAAIALYRAMDMTFWLLQAEAALAHVGYKGQIE